MVRSLRLEGKNLLILHAIRASTTGYLTPSAIARQLAISPQLSSKKVALLELNGFVKRKPKGMLVEVWLTELGLQTVARLPADKVDTPNPKSEPEPTIRPHALEVRFPLKDTLPSGTPTALLQAHGIYSKPLGLRGQEGAAYFAGEYEGLLTHKALILYGQDMPEAPLSADVAILARDEIKAVFRVAEQIEARDARLRLRRTAKGLLLGEVVKHEIAFKNHQIAKEAKANDDKVYAHDTETGELIAITDFSHKFPEFEAVNRKSAVYNAEEMQKATEWMATGQMRGWAGSVDAKFDKFIGSVDRLEHQLDLHLAVEQKQADNLDLMNITLKEMRKELRLERERRAQRRLP